MKTVSMVTGLHQGRYLVHLTDDGNLGSVEPTKIFKGAVEIPEGEVLDGHVAMKLEPGEQVMVKEEVLFQVKEKLVPENLPSKWTVGNDCSARWAEDGRWYIGTMP